MKNRKQIAAMQERIESAVSPGESKQALIMALEWVLNSSVSTSLGLDEWLTEQLDYEPHN